MLASVLDRRLWKGFAALRGLSLPSLARTQRILAVLLSLGLLLSPVGISSGHADVASGHGWTANDGHDRFEAEHGHEHDEDPAQGSHWAIVTATIQRITPTTQRVAHLALFR